MADPLMLDTTVLGRLAHRRPLAADVQLLDDLLAAPVRIFLPEIADYEVRRSLLLHGLQASLRELDSLKKRLRYAPINTAIMLRAAALWADARRGGKPTADSKALDGDVILAAQALEVGATVMTENVAHLSRYVRAISWSSLRAP